MGYCGILSYSTVKRFRFAVSLVNEQFAKKVTHWTKYYLSRYLYNPISHNEIIFGRLNNTFQFRGRDLDGLLFVYHVYHIPTVLTNSRLDNYFWLLGFNSISRNLIFLHNTFFHFYATKDAKNFIYFKIFTLSKKLKVWHHTVTKNLIILY